MTVVGQDRVDAVAQQRPQPQQVPFEMADAVLGQTCRVQRRVRGLPARVVACLLLAGEGTGVIPESRIFSWTLIGP